MFGKNKDQIKVLEDMDPDRIYIENVRHYFSVDKNKAVEICNAAEQRGLFEKWIGYEHPIHHHLVTEHPFGESPPSTEFHDIQSEFDEDEQQDFKIQELKQVVFYRALA